MNGRLLTLGGVTAAFAVALPAVLGAVLRREPATEFQGYVEGKLLYVAAEETARIEHLAVEAGDVVAPGQVMFRQESSVKDAERQAAAARLREAHARLASIKAAQQRPEEIEVLRAAERRAAAARELSKAELARRRELFAKGATSKALLDQAQAAYGRDDAALQEVGRQIDAARLGGREDDIEAAEALVEAAKAALTEVERRLAKSEAKAPAGGRVEDVFYRAGEVVPAGKPVLALLPDGNLRVRFFVPEPALSALAVGGSVRVSCDGCAGIAGRITFIAREAEFTPPVIFSKEERSKLVFKVEASFMTEKPILPVGLPVTVAPAGNGATAGG